MWQRWPWLRQGKLQLLRFIRLRGAPEEIAKGFALGVFVSFTPTYGVQMVTSVVVAGFLGWNRLAAYMAASLPA